MKYFAVVDTETTWDNRVMSVGAVVADGLSLQPVDSRYYVLTPEYLTGGMFSCALFPNSQLSPAPSSREEAMASLHAWFLRYGICAVFAYNAAFDHSHLPELASFRWYDIMRLAAYRQYNPSILSSADCYSTGRLRRGYGVEAMLRRLSCDRTYCETHNALLDAVDELKIMRLLNHPLERYIPL